MQAEDVKKYLEENPQFFEENASFLAGIHLPSPHGEGAISLAERQQLAQRDKINALEDRFAELVLNAKTNDAIAAKVHDFTVQLQQAKDFDTVEQLLSHYLPEHFSIADTYLRIWAHPADIVNMGNLVFSEVSEATRRWVGNIHNVYCGTAPTSISTDDWFIEPAPSVAVLPLRGKSLYGFLALAGDHAERFYEDMGTDFLQKLDDHISAALSRFVLFE